MRPVPTSASGRGGSGVTCAFPYPRVAMNQAGLLPMPQLARSVLSQENGDKNV